MFPRILRVIVLLLGCTGTIRAGSAFTYQGRLLENGTPASGRFDLRCELFPGLNGGSPTSPAITNFDISVLNGVFTTTLDFGVDAFRSEEHTSELQSLTNLVCRLLLEKKKKKISNINSISPLAIAKLIQAVTPFSEVANIDYGAPNFNKTHERLLTPFHVVIYSPNAI